MTAKKGGKHSFADDPQKVSEAGRKGSGHATGGNVRSDTDRAERARKGGQHSHGEARR